MTELFLNREQVKNILGLTCEKNYDYEKGLKQQEELIGKCHHYNIVEWNNICGKMTLNYTQELWEIVTVLSYHGKVLVENDGRYMLLDINELKL